MVRLLLLSVILYCPSYKTILKDIQKKGYTIDEIVSVEYNNGNYGSDWDCNFKVKLKPKNKEIKLELKKGGKNAIKRKEKSGAV